MRQICRTSISMKTMKTIQTKLNLALFVLCLTVFGAACGYVSFAPKNTNSTVTQMEKLTDLQQEIKAMETADFEYIFVFKRKDDGVFDKADRDYIRANRPSDVNRWIATDDKKAFVAGSNFVFAPESLEIMRQRFIVEDYSKPKVPQPAANNANQEVNK